MTGHRARGRISHVGGWDFQHDKPIGWGFDCAGTTAAGVSVTPDGTFFAGWSIPELRGIYLSGLPAQLDEWKRKAADAEAERDALREQLEEPREIIERLIVPLQPVKYQPWNTVAVTRAKLFLSFSTPTEEPA